MKRLLPLLLTLTLYPLTALAQGDVKRGKYIMGMGSCVSCHKTPKRKNADLGGGHAIKTPFGTFYVPNITPDKDSGIGGWSEKQFIEAMTQGVSPEGKHYYPAFPYTSYAKMSREDLVDLKAYLDTVAPIKNAVPDHDLGFPFNLRFMMFGWKMLFFDDRPFAPNPDKSDEWNRGAYIVNGAAHCGECHTARNMFGGLDLSKKFLGNSNGPDKEKIPSMLPKWKLKEYFMALRIGMKPDGDFLGGSMGHVISQTTSKLSKEDLKAISLYLSEYE
ncbi:c-type cytochrome [Candidatus Terasakiella magnetica]|nr:cytochrome c [Candidatus Terasakiella magnetica]